jgi:Na+-driven multidrug efflux pump
MFKKFFIKEYIPTFIPLFFSIISGLLFSLLDTYMVGQYNSVQLAAIGLGFPVFFLIQTVVGSYGAAITMIISKLVGRDFKNKLQTKLNISIYLSIITTVIFSILYYSLIPYFINNIADINIRNILDNYLFIIGLGIVIEGLLLTFSGFLNAIHKVKLTSYMNISFLFLNLILNYIFIFGVEGYISDYGIYGAAYSTLFTRFLSFLTLLYFLYKLDYIKFIHIPKTSFIVRSKIIIHTATPLVLKNSLGMLSGLIIMIFIGKLPLEEILSYTAGGKVVLFLLFIVMPTLATMNILINRYIGEKNKVKAIYLLKTTFTIIISYAFFVLILVNIFSSNIERAFITDPKINDTFILYISIIPLSYPFITIYYAISALLVSTRHKYMAVTLSFIQSFILELGISITVLYFYDFHTMIYTICGLNILLGLLSLFIFRYKIMPELI